MGKKRTKGEYNDFTEDTRYQTDNNVHTTLQSTSTLTRDVSPPSSSQHRTSTHNKTKAKKPPLTHFLCLPLVTPKNRTRLSQALDELKNDVQKLTPVPPTAVRPVGTLHLTLGVMSLSPQALDDATTHLQDLDLAKLLRGITTQHIASLVPDTPTVSENFGALANPPSSLAQQTDPDHLSIRLRGLAPMQNPHRTSVLYAHPEDKSQRLLPFAESLRRGFEERGWIVRDERGLKLHATVVNTVYAKSRGRGNGRAMETETQTQTQTVDSQSEVVDAAPTDEVPVEAEGEESQAGRHASSSSASWMRFDASSLIDAYEDFVWAEDVRIERVQICKMGARKVVDEGSGEVVDERYEVVAEKRL